MYKFEEFCVRFDDHITAVNNNVLDNWPTVRIKQNDSFILGITIHKWNLEPSGNALAIYKISEEILENDLIWTNPSKSIYFESLQKKLKTVHNDIMKQQTTEMINDIEDGIFENVIVYKYHANQWRPIEKKKTKWTYLGKQEKTDMCNVQRLLH